MGGTAKLAHKRKLVDLRNYDLSRLSAVFLHVDGPTRFRPYHLRAVGLSFVKLQPAQSGASDVAFRPDSHSRIRGRERLSQQASRVQRRPVLEIERPRRHHQVE